MTAAFADDIAETAVPAAAAHAARPTEVKTGGPGHGPGVGGTALPDRAKGVPCPVFESRGSWASATPRRKAVS